MARAPVIELERVLIVTVQEELRDQDAQSLQDQLIQTLERSDAHGVLIDLSVVETVDSFLGRVLHDIAIGVRLLGGQTVITGIQPAVAITLVELGLELPGVMTALNVRKGLRLLRQAITREHLAHHNGHHPAGDQRER